MIGLHSAGQVNREKTLIEDDEIPIVVASSTVKKRKNRSRSRWIFLGVVALTVWFLFRKHRNGERGGTNSVELVYFKVEGSSKTIAIVHIPHTNLNLLPLKLHPASLTFTAFSGCGLVDASCSTILPWDNIKCRLPANANGDTESTAVLVTGAPLHDCASDVVHDSTSEIVHDSTSERQTILSWLDEHPLERGIGREQLREFVLEAPISQSSKRFIINNLYEVSGDIYVANLAPRGPLFRRHDFFDLFVVPPALEAKVLLLIGPRSQGKTCALPLELLHARKEKYGIKDRVIFYHAGANDVPTGKTQNILLLLAHMKIAACWDEFTSLSARIRLEYKILLEDTRFHLDQLSVILFGCSGVEIIESGLPVFSGLLSRGGLKLDLPKPGLGLIWAMFVKCSGLSKDDIWTSKASEMFLHRFTIYGYNLAAHMGSAAFAENLAALGKIGLQGITFLHGSRLHAIRKLMANHGKPSGIDNEDLIHLISAGYIARRWPEALYDFLDPQLVAFQHVDNDDVNCAEGKVFEIMVRDYNLLLQPLLHKISEVVNISYEQLFSAAKTMFHGSIPKNCEIDGLFSVTNSDHVNLLVVLSCKRNQSLQNWERSFLDFLRRLSEMKSDSKTLLNYPQCQQLENATDILLVAVSALSDSRMDLSSQPTMFESKPVRCMAIVMTDLLRLLRLSEVVLISD